MIVGVRPHEAGLPAVRDRPLDRRAESGVVLDVDFRVDRPAVRFEAVGDVRNILTVYGDARLLSFDRDPATRVPTVEVAHEALLTEWERLRSWIDESRDDLRTLRRLSSTAAEWRASGRDSSFLLTGSRLSHLVDWSQTPASLLVR